MPGSQELFPKLPTLRSAQDLADWLAITKGELIWLTDSAVQPRQDNDKSVQASGAGARHYHSRWIKKRSVGWRLIECPKPMLKFAQRRILQGILNKVPPHALSFGFCKNRNVTGFVRPHVRRPACLKMDLLDFFPSLTAARVIGLFHSIGFTSPVCNLLGMLSTVQSSEHTMDMAPGNQKHSPSLQKFRRRHLPQGSPTSPAIANLCAYRLDCRLSGLAKKRPGTHFTRYADDLLFSGNREFARRSKRFAAIVGAIVLEEGFEVNYRKTHLMMSSQRQKAAGMVINQRINLVRDEFDRLKAILHNCERFGVDSQNLEQHPAFLEHLNGKICWVELLNANRGFRLRQSYERILEKTV